MRIVVLYQNKIDRIDGVSFVYTFFYMFGNIDDGSCFEHEVSIGFKVVIFQIAIFRRLFYDNTFARIDDVLGVYLVLSCVRNFIENPLD